jgi:hypothetical protein
MEGNTQNVYFYANKKNERKLRKLTILNMITRLSCGGYLHRIVFLLCIKARIPAFIKETAWHIYGQQHHFLYGPA